METLIKNVNSKQIYGEFLDEGIFKLRFHKNKIILIDV